MILNALSGLWENTACDPPRNPNLYGDPTIYEVYNFSSVAAPFDINAPHTDTGQYPQSVIACRQIISGDDYRKISGDFDVQMIVGGTDGSALDCFVYFRVKLYDSNNVRIDETANDADALSVYAISHSELIDVGYGDFGYSLKGSAIRVIPLYWPIHGPFPPGHPQYNGPFPAKTYTDPSSNANHMYPIAGPAHGTGLLDWWDSYYAGQDWATANGKNYLDPANPYRTNPDPSRSKFTFDLRTWASGRLISGKTENDIDHVVVFLQVSNASPDHNLPVTFNVIDLPISLVSTTASPSAGTYSTPQSVVLAADEAATTEYVIGESGSSAPSGSGTAYTGVITINATCRLWFRSTDTAENVEEWKYEDYTIEEPAALDADNATSSPTGTTAELTGTLSANNGVAAPTGTVAQLVPVNTGSVIRAPDGTPMVFRWPDGSIANFNLVV